MSDIAFLLKEAEALEAANRTFAVGTVVKIEGSTYRQAGGRMLIRDDLSTWGLISGGCLEEEIAREAEAVLKTGRPVLRSYDMIGPDDQLGFNTGCNGIVDVLITRGSGALTHLRSSMKDRDTGVLIQTISGEDSPGAVRWVAADNVHVLSDDATLLSAVNETLRLQQTMRLEQPQRTLMLEHVQPPLSLLVFGTGADVHPLVRLGAMLGWEVTLIGRRPQPWLQEHFPAAHHHAFLMHPESVLEHIQADDRTTAVIMNHNLDRDRILAQELLRSPIAYIGLLGPRARCREIVEAALAAGIPSAALDRLYGPAGLDTGAESPVEIALSIVAEILSVTNSRPATRLRDGVGPIHAAALCATGSE